MRISIRSQRVIVWWALAFTTIYGLSLGFLLHMIPPPSPTKSTADVARFYAEHHDAIRIGAVIASWSSAFMLPLSVVVAMQMSRQEKGKPIWSVMTVAGGAMMSVFLVLPPVMWGAAAFTPERSASATAALHDLGMLTLTTTDQYYIFMWVAVVVVCFLPQRASHTPFPRWFGYLSAWIATMFEFGAFAFLPRTGPLAWNGVLVFWSPLTLFGVWIGTMSFLLLRSLKRQQAEERAEDEAEAAAAGRPDPGSAGPPEAVPA